MRRSVWVCSLFLLLAAGSGCSVALKGGVHSFSDRDVEGVRRSAGVEAVELEAGIWEGLDERVDLALAINVLDSLPQTDLEDLRLTARYNFRHSKRFRPYVGGGAGYFRLFTTNAVSVSGLGVCFSNFCILPDGTISSSGVATIGQTSTTLASGLFPHVVAGLNIGITKLIDLVVEDRFDFAKEDAGIEFDSNQIQIGIRFDFAN